jgi:hypothetical protein
MAAASWKRSASLTDVLQGISESKDEVVKYGECMKVVAVKGTQCELCDLCFHCKCENIVEDTIS